MVLDDDGEVIVDHRSLVMHKAELEAVLILDLVGLQVAKHSGSRKVVGQPVCIESRQYTNNIHCLAYLM